MTLTGDNSPAAMPVPSNHTVHLADIQRVLTLFAEAFAGEARRIETSCDDNGVSTRHTTHRMTGIGSDGQAIYLPRSINKYSHARQNFGAYRIAVLHQAGYDDAGTFRFSLQTAKQQIPSLASTRIIRPTPPAPAWPGQAPPTPPLDLELFFSSGPVPQRLQTVFSILEGWRIDLRIRARYPGAIKDLNRETRYALEQRELLPLPNGVAGHIEVLRRYSLGADHKDLLGTTVHRDSREAILALTANLTDESTVYDSAHLALAVDDILEKSNQTADTGLSDEELEALAEQAAVADEATGDPQAQEGSPIDFRGDPFQMPAINKRRTLAQELADPDDLTYLSDATQDADDADETSAVKTPSAQPTTLTTVKEDEKRLLIDEWDYLQQRYLKGWCTLVEYRLRGEAGTFHRDLMNRHRANFTHTRRQLNAIRPEAIRRERRQPDGEEIELDRLIEWLADQRAGHTSDDRLYMQRQRAQRDVAAAFLLDMSASTDFPVVDPKVAAANRDDAGNNAAEADDIGWAPLTVHPGARNSETPRRVIDVARESLALMSTALETLGDRHAIFGFSGQGRHWVSYGVAKMFNEPCSARTWGALAAVGPQGSTRMGTAVRRTTEHLRRESARLKVLIIISDGYPQDLDYGPVRGNDEYGLQDTAMALREAHRLGIETFCLTVDPAGHDYLRRMCPDQRYLVIDEVNALPLELGKVYRALTTRQQS